MNNGNDGAQWHGEDVSAFMGPVWDPSPYNTDLIPGDFLNYFEFPVGGEVGLANPMPESASSPRKVQPRCDLCGYQSNYEKDIVRHTRSKHSQPGDPVFQCRCGKTDRRKDNHKRHVRSCSKRGSIGKPYICNCGAQYTNLKEYLNGLRRQGCAHPQVS